MPNTLKRPREERLELRVTHDDKLALEAAARHQGVTVSAYLLAHSLPSARQEASQAILLTNPARNFLMELLAKPVRINSALAKAMRRAKASHA